MSKSKILVQIDSDSHASAFDSIVAIDAGVDHLLTHDHVCEDDVQAIVHGAMFTRGVDDLKSTALFFGGSDVARTEALLQQAKKCFFGPMRVSLLSDPNGCNTTASAAVLSAQQHIDLAGKTIAVLAGTGPVGHRIAQLIAGPATAGLATPTIRVCSRQLDKATAACAEIESKVDAETKLIPVQSETSAESIKAVADADVVFSAGAAGISLLPEGWLASDGSPAVAVDLNAVPPVGIHGIETTDQGLVRQNTVCFGAVGVGQFKMKLHKRCLEMLFGANDLVLELEEVYAVGRDLIRAEMAG